MSVEKVDFVVIGAGWFGLAAAKTHHQLHPDSTIAILDSAVTLGGVWAEHRLYPGLKTNNMLGTYEYPDFPMDTKTFGVEPGQHIPGFVVHAYLNMYTVHFGIKDSIRCEHRVESAERLPEGWLLDVRIGVAFDKQIKIEANKLVVATGLTSEPFLPVIKGQEHFDGPIFHSKDFLRQADTLKTVSSVTVFGGTKSAWDIVYAYATKGIKVEWVIRETGHGPAWLAPPYVTPLQKWLEKLAHTRLLTWFSPCSWALADGFPRIRRFLHGTAFGRALTNGFWKVLGGDVIALNKYDSHPETSKLKPWSHPMVTASSFSILNYDTDFFDLVRNGIVSVHISNISHLSNGTVHLTNGTEVKTNAIACATGWKHLPPIKFLPEGIDEELAIPHSPSENAFPTEELAAQIDEEIMKSWPKLKNLPIQNKRMEPLLECEGLTTTDKINPSTPLTPYTLYRFMVPPSAKHFARRDIAFAGVLMNFTVPIVALAQSVWIDAFFYDHLPKLHAVEDDPKEWKKVEHDTVLHSRFAKWRYPAGYGSKFPDFVFDAVPYLDLLLSDLGLKVHRKGGIVAEMLHPYGPEDYKDLVEEWKEQVNHQ